MTKLLVAAGAAAFLAVTSVAAFADQVNGTVTGVDVKSGGVTLNNGKVYIVPQSVPASSLQVGDVVTITYTTDASGTMQASTAVIQKADPKS